MYRIWYNGALSDLFFVSKSHFSVPVVHCGFHRWPTAGAGDTPSFYQDKQSRQAGTFAATSLLLPRHENCICYTFVEVQWCSITSIDRVAICLLVVLRIAYNVVVPSPLESIYASQSADPKLLGHDTRVKARSSQPFFINQIRSIFHSMLLSCFLLCIVAPESSATLGIMHVVFTHYSPPRGLLLFTVSREVNSHPSKG